MLATVLDIFGLHHGTDLVYLADSGLIPTLLGLGTIIAWWRRHECHVDRCHRWAKHPAAQGQFTVCGRHHPDVPRRITVEHVHRAHHRSLDEGGK